MSQTPQNAPEFHFPERMEYDGEHYDLVYDPGNPQRPQVIPNYQAMFPQETSAIEQFTWPGQGQLWLAIIDALSPAQSMQQTGGLPAIERRYLCFRLFEREEDIPRATQRIDASGKVAYVPSALAVRPQEMVIYAKSTPGGHQSNRAQRLITALLGTAQREMPAPRPDWTRDFARMTLAAPLPVSVEVPDAEAPQAEGYDDAR